MLNAEQRTKIPVEERFDNLTDIQRLEKYFDIILDISIKTHGQKADWAGVRAATAFAKLGMTCQTILRIHPKSSYFTPVKDKIHYDISSIAALCRNVFDNYYVLSYFAHTPNNPEALFFREKVWNFHELSERKKMYESSSHWLRETPELKAKVMELYTKYENAKNELVAMPLFKVLEPTLRNKVKEGKTFVVEDAKSLNQKADIDHGLYRYVFRKCSAHVHSAPFSLKQLYDFQADNGDFEELIAQYITFTCAYAVFAIREFKKIASVESEDVSDDIKLWSGSLKTLTKP